MKSQARARLGSCLRTVLSLYNQRSERPVKSWDLTPYILQMKEKWIVITPAEEAQAALNAMRNNPYGKDACIIGKVAAQPTARVLLKTSIGGTRILDSLAGELLPRIC